MNADEIVKALLTECEDCSERTVGGGCKAIYYCSNRDAADWIESLQGQLTASQARERAHEAAIKRHYTDMTSQCFICYSCINHDARERAHWNGKELEGYACTGCGKGKPKRQFDVERFSGQEGAK